MATNNSCDYKPTQYNIQTGGASGTLNNVAPSATSGIPVISQGSSSQPVFGTAVVAGGGTGAISLTGVLIGNGTSPVTGNTVTQYDVLVGGASNAISSVGPGTSGQILQSGGNSANPAYSTATYPATTTINQLLYSSANNTVGGVTAGDYGVLISSSSGVPSWLANGTTGQVLTATTSGTPSWESAASGGISTIDGDSGSITGSTVTFTALNKAGVTVSFSGSGSTMDLNTTDANFNTIIGYLTAGNSGSSAGGSNNTILGYAAAYYFANSSNDNTIIGYNAGGSIGRFASCSYNTLLGMNAGLNYTGNSGSDNSNIQIGYNVAGTDGESNVLRIGTGTGTGNGNLNKAIICGIQGITVTGTAILISSSDQLGIAVSSERYKENIKDLQSSRVLELNPVSFNYKVGDDHSAQTGLIAEEVYKVMPELVVLDKEGLPQSVKYHDLPVLLLLEIQKLCKEIDELKGRLV